MVRSLGAPVRTDSVRAFLGLNALEDFDLGVLNALPTSDLQLESGSDVELARRIRAKALELLPRVKQETDDPNVAGALVRELALSWYRESPTTDMWSERARLRWGGLFADSRTLGGRLRPWLLRRLASLTHGASRRRGITAGLRRRLTRSDEFDRSLERTPAQGWSAESAQALLDDLSARSRDGAPSYALVRLSELATQRGTDVVNQGLAMLLGGPERGPFVLLHPNRYPDCRLTTVKPPPPGAIGSALSYTLLIATTGTSPGTGTTLSQVEGGGEPALQGGMVWEGSGPTAEAWGPLLASLQRGNGHLEAPPKDYRKNVGYVTLRDLLLCDAAARRAFLSVKWRGRPSGLALLASLLQRGELTPDAATDYEYLDAELGDAARGDPEFRPDPPLWALPGGEVRREGDFQRGFRYTYEGRKAPTGPPP